MPPLFPTLASAGYLVCSHPRPVAAFCLDCGAKQTGPFGGWREGSMEFERLPLQVA